jgi:hypothetical protein
MSAPTHALQPDLPTLFASYRTAELATIGKDGAPIAWPVMAVPDGERLVVSTSVGLPGKAFNIRRDPRVSLLFSDPTGSALDDPPAVLVQGAAECPDVVVVDPAGREDYWRTLFARQPSARHYGATPLTRRLFDWYYMRLFVEIVPRRVVLVDRPDPASPALRPQPLPGLAGDVARQLAAYPTAVLSWRGEEGSPVSARTTVAVTPDGLRPRPVPGLRPGPAGLLCHAHDARTWGLRSFSTTGYLADTPQGWLFTPDRLLPGASPSPRALVRTVRSARATASRYLAHRSLPRPDVPWAAYKELYR